MPSVLQVASFVENFFPKRARDVPFLFHVPGRRPMIHNDVPDRDHTHDASAVIQDETTPRDYSDLASRTCTRMILSVTQEPGLYRAIQLPSKYPPTVFLHRPFGLVRRDVRKGTTVLSSHVGFDEVLTVGFNVVLAERLGVLTQPHLELRIVEEIHPLLASADAVETSPRPQTTSATPEERPAKRTSSIVCLKGYKGDPERRIGLVGALVTPTPATEMLQKVKDEFGELEAVFGFGNGDDYSTVMQQDKSINLEPLISAIAAYGQHIDHSCPVCCLAIMNAFSPEEVDRVISSISKHNLLNEAESTSKDKLLTSVSPQRILYLTGAARIPGLTYALEQGLKVICVGHRVCEEWGIRYLASEIRRQFPQIEVEEILGDEKV